MKLTKVAALLHLLSLVVVACYAQSAEYVETEETLRRILASLSNALDFMASEYMKLNLDAVIGLRLVEGQFRVLQKHIGDSGRRLPADDILQSINNNRVMAGTISNRSLPFIEKGQNEYYNNIGFIIQEGFWEQDYSSRDLDLHHVRRPKVMGEAMHEADSDSCLQELRTDLESTNFECSVSMNCWKLMTSPGYRFYSLSHEVFYLLIGESTGCLTDVRSVADRLSGQFCASMLVEARSVAEDGFPVHKRDIFMEDAALCGVYGYRQFFNTDWLEKILSWQRAPRGCWGMSEEQMARARADERTHSRDHERTKREERVLRDGCECHRTAVALGALVQYVRYTVEYMQSISGYEYF